jgi:hypothetical protein
MYVYRNTTARSRNHISRGKAIRITYVPLCMWGGGTGAGLWASGRVGVHMRGRVGVYMRVRM